MGVPIQQAQGKAIEERSQANKMERDPWHQTPGRNVHDSEVIDRILRQNGSSLEGEKERIRAEEQAKKAEEERLRHELMEREEGERIRKQEEAILSAYPRDMVVSINEKIVEKPESLDSMSCPECGNPLPIVKTLMLYLKRTTTFSKNRMSVFSMDGEVRLGMSTMVFTKTCPCPNCGHELRIMIDGRCFYDGKPMGLLADQGTYDDLEKGRDGERP
ncbi:hypothetical protein [Methanomassiliicoccus luminyensis]|uniref:hypothetical protein n=1 Tax=Methanomassiliicoccus luminyensis TaxID=1080712 RepID=UPI0003779933|nr:hypothetical protein [Methanomassiliicoccus luminyensis]